MTDQTLWRCINCKTVTPENQRLVDNQVQHSFVVQYGCPHCRHMNCLEDVDLDD